VLVIFSVFVLAYTSSQSSDENILPLSTNWIETKPEKQEFIIADFKKAFTKYHPSSIGYPKFIYDENSNLVFEKERAYKIDIPEKLTEEDVIVLQMSKDEKAPQVSPIQEVKSYLVLIKENDKTFSALLAYVL